MSIQTYAPGHAGMFPISSGAGSFIKTADHAAEMREAYRLILLAKTSSKLVAGAFLTRKMALASRSAKSLVDESEIWLSTHTEYAPKALCLRYLEGE